MEATFPQFSKLPAELQLLIWEAVFNQRSKPKRQVIEGQLENYDKTGPPFNQHSWYRGTSYNRLLVFPGAQQEAIPPAMLSVCHTSRQVALRRSKFTNLPLNPHDMTSGPVWFDFRHDIVILSRFKTHRYGIDDEWSKIGNKEVLRQIQRLAIPWSAFHPGQQRFLTRLEVVARWSLLLGNMSRLFPVLTDIYLFVPAVRQQALYEFSSDHHPREPAKCKSLRPLLKPAFKDHGDVKLPDCDCLETPSTLGKAIDELYYGLKLEEHSEYVWQWGEAMNVHGRWLVRDGLDMELLCGVPGIEVESAFCKESSGRD
ncbi:hypothetical protein GQ607_007736 [Colletotrichum asianum]|uniref:2EXR domain-containing protein n=1 Tax=Colletotrichum asianum TaxID=702518 RepID=A0A8H3WF35_9PEZI|nr:hypothetical protein GQ607_007736 [Colletotrichum asianum]